MDTSAETRVVASFTFIVALLLGAWNSVPYLLGGQSELLSISPRPLSLISAMLPVVVTAVAYQAAQEAKEHWARTLGGAAVMLGGLCIVGAVLNVTLNW